MPSLRECLADAIRSDWRLLGLLCLLPSLALFLLGLFRERNRLRNSHKDLRDSHKSKDAGKSLEDFPASFDWLTMFPDMPRKRQ